VQPFLDLLFPGTVVMLEEDTLEIIEIACQLLCVEPRRPSRS
jgi:hypothetical protein